MRGTVLSPEFEVYVGDTEGLLNYLASVDLKHEMKLELFDKISAGIYREQADSAMGLELIPQLVEAVATEFRDLDDFRNLVRNSDRLFPALEEAHDSEGVAKRLKVKFREMRQEMKANTRRERKHGSRTAAKAAPSGKRVVMSSTS